jgi:metal-dependent hydrolase (beta-lactamase superfamily II)
MIDTIKEGLYNVRLAVNLDHLNIDRIESISLSQRHDDHLGALEARSQQDIAKRKKEYGLLAFAPIHQC